MQRGTSWQEQYVTERLESTLCLFVGTSLTDPNLVRYLYGYKQSPARRHAAVFVREGDLDEDVDEVRAARERAVAKRWGRCGVECLFVDHFADAAQLLYEIAHRRSAGDGYEPVAVRAERALTRIEDVAMLRNAGQERFAERQVALSRWLRTALHRTLPSALGRTPPADERFLTGWAHSDRAHQDPTTIESVPIRPESSWVAVRAVSKGVRVGLDRESDISRWRFIRALPLILDRPTRLPIGCLTIATTRPGEKSVLNTMPEDAKQALHNGLTDAIAPQLARVADPS